MPMPTYRSTNYAGIYLWLAIGVTCLLLFAGQRFIQPAFDKLMGDLNLDSFEKDFQDLQHPSETEYLASRSELGDFGGSQEGCDLFLGEIRRYSGNQEGILTAYSDQDIKGFPLQVVFLAGDEFPGGMVDTLPAPLENLVGWELIPSVDQGALYLVYLVVLDDEGDLKLNCP